jgi:hypothetical protein
MLGTTGKAGTPSSPVAVPPPLPGKLHADNARMKIGDADNRRRHFVRISPPKWKGALRGDAEKASRIHYARLDRPAITHLLGPPATLLRLLCN